MLNKNEIILQDLEKRWYQSLANGEPDYTVYDDNAYVIESDKCWNIYSKKYLKLITSPKSLVNISIVQDIGNIENIIDMGCGNGKTTSTLKYIFPNSNVYGTNREQSLQYQKAKKLGELYNFSVVGDIKLLKDKKDGLIFASEYFEHFEKPVEHLLETLEYCRPKYLIIANAFTADATGHFNTYLHNGSSYNGRQTSRLFNKTLRDNGYENVKTKLWNSRPTYWRKLN